MNLGTSDCFISCFIDDHKLNDNLLLVNEKNIYETEERPQKLLCINLFNIERETQFSIYMQISALT